LVNGKKREGREMKKQVPILALMLLLLASSAFLSLAHPIEAYSSVSLAKTPSATLVESGSNVSYLYNATNTGTANLTGSIYDDVFGLVGSFVNLQPGGWVGFNVTHVITENTTNTATVYATAPTGLNVSATASAFVAVYYLNSDLSLTKTPSATLVESGSNVSYLYNATNTGETALTGAIVDDVFGAVGSFVNLQPGGWVGYNITHTITENTTNTATAFGTDKYGRNVTSTDKAFVQVVRPTIESCDSAGTKKDTFMPGDEVYANGTWYQPQTTYDIYLVEDVTWVDGMAIPPRVPGTATTVTTDANGNIPPTLLWSNPLTPGKYDIIVDVDGDGLYYSEADALDDNDVEVTAGLFVIPEIPFGAVTSVLSMFGALIGFTKFKRSRPKLQLK
jgi:hypothetical protein